MPLPLNYATQYSQALANAFPHVLRFGALYTTPNNARYRVVDAKTIKIPILTTSGRSDGDRDVIGGKQRNHSNDWEIKELTNHRKWDTLIHPVDVIQTNMITTIQNVTQTFNEQEKFPEMDRYCVSKIFADWDALPGKTPDTTTLTVSNILGKIDDMMMAMDEARIPQTGRILYITPAIKKLIKTAESIQRTLDLKNGSTVLTRDVSRLDELSIEVVESDIMKTLFDFTVGSVPAVGAKQIHMFMVHPLTVFTPVQYQFAQLDAPAAMSDGKWVYFEESFEDVFILNEKADGINFCIDA